MGGNYFCQQFEYGKSDEVYWTYDRMVLPLEEFINIFKDIHPVIDFIFIFDHTCSIDIGREYRLNVTQMNSGYGGTKLDTIPKNINQEVGCLVPYGRISEVGYDQNILFQEGGDVPFWITLQDRVFINFSQRDEPQLKDNKKAELIGNIKISGVDIYVVKGDRVGQLQYIYHQKLSL